MLLLSEASFVSDINNLFSHILLSLDIFEMFDMLFMKEARYLRCDSYDSMQLHNNPLFQVHRVLLFICLFICLLMSILST